MADISFISEFGIGGFEDNKQRFSEFINDADGKDFTMRISSLGGSVDDALSIYSQMRKYAGKITAELDGMVASAATIIAMGADEVKMDTNAFFLVHKSLSGLDVFGAMNEDDITKLIEDLEHIKETNQKIDLKIADIYSAKTRKRAKTMLSLMSEDKWLTAEEAQEFGFIDSIENTTKQKKQLSNMAIVAKAKGLPELPIINQKSEKMEEKKEKVSLTDIWNAVKNLGQEKEDAPNSYSEEEVKEQMTEIQNSVKADMEAKAEELAKKEAEIAALKAEIEASKAKKTETASNEGTSPEFDEPKVELTAEQVFGNNVKELVKRHKIG